MSRGGTSTSSDLTTSSHWTVRVGRASWLFVGLALAVAIAVIAVSAFWELVVPCIIAVFSAVVFAPIVDWMADRRVPRPVAAAACTLMVVALAVLIVVVVVESIIDQSAAIGVQLDNAWQQLAGATGSSAIGDFFADIQVDLPSVGRTVARGSGVRVGSLINSAAGLVSGMVLALVILYYLLRDGRAMMASLAVRRTPNEAAQTERILTHAAQAIRANSRGRAMLAAAQAVFIGFVMGLLGVPNAPSIAVVNFVAAFVPYLGAFVGGAFAVLMALSEGGTALALWALLAILVMNLLLENLLEPRFIGSSMRMNPLAVLLATVSGGLIAGLVGLVIAAPVTAIGLNLWRELRHSGFFAPAGRTPEPDDEGSKSPPASE